MWIRLNFISSSILTVIIIHSKDFITTYSITVFLFFAILGLVEPQPTWPTSHIEGRGEKVPAPRRFTYCAKACSLRTAPQADLYL
jgi:hypothetical protein